MKRYFGFLLLSMFFMIALSGCEKKELLEQKTVYGQATINDMTLYQYTTIGEGVSNKYWFLPLGQDNNIIIKDGVCYLQMFLREIDEKEIDNFWLILIGCYYDDNFPTIGKEYKIVTQNQIDLGNIYNSFYWSGKLRDFYSNNPEFESYGIAGLSVPPFHDKFIPLEGSIIFSKASMEGAYTIAYNIEGNENSTGESYCIIGEIQGKLKFVS